MKKLWMLIGVILVPGLILAQPETNPLFLSDMGFHAGGWSTEETVRTTGDVDGDGKADLIGFSGDAVRVAFSNGDSFRAVQVLSQDFKGWSFQRHVRTVGDVNGDGMADLIGFGDAGVFVAMSTGSGFGPLKPWLPDLGNVKGGWKNESTVRCVGDVNGDGKADLIGFSGSAVRVSFSTGTGFSPVQNLSQSFSGWSYTEHIRTVADVNGDGKADLVGLGDAGTYVAFSTGNGFGPLQLIFNDLGTANGWRVKKMVRLLADMNGDGKADIVGFNTDHVIVCYSTGRTFEQAVEISLDFSDKTGYVFDRHVVTAADVNGDKAADLIGFANDGVHVQLTARAAR